MVTTLSLCRDLGIFLSTSPWDRSIFIVFEEEAAGVAKKMAGYHQFHAVRRAVEKTVEAASPEGDGRCGVV